MHAAASPATSTASTPWRAPVAVPPHPLAQFWRLHRFTVLLLAAWLLAMAALVGYSAWEIERLRDAERETTEETATRLSVLAAETLAGALKRAAALAPDLASDDSQRRETAFVRAHHARYLRDPAVTAMDAPAEGVAYGDQLFTPAREGAASGAPFRFSLRAPATNQRVSFAFDMAATAHLIEAARPPAHWASLVFTRDGAALARWPAAENAAEAETWAPLMRRLAQLAQDGAGEIIAVSPFDGQERMIAVRALPHTPLAIALSLSLSHEAAQVDRLSHNILMGVAAALAGITLVFALLIGAGLRRERAAAQALANDQIKSAFLAALSHELRTPLNAVIGFSELLLADPERLDAVSRSQITLVHEAGQHLQDVVERALDYVWIDSPGRRLQRDVISWAQIVADLEPAWRQLAARRGQTVEIGCACPLFGETCHGCHVLGDPFAARRVTESLAAFAARVAGDGGAWRVGFIEPDGDVVTLLAWTGPRPEPDAPWREVGARLQTVENVYIAPDPDALALEAGLRLATAMGWRLEVDAAGGAIRAVAPTH